MSDSKNRVNNDGVVYRTLFIGLGGTGGKVLTKLHKKLTPEQKERSHMIYLDLDKKDTDNLEGQGVPTVRISSSDTVRDVMNYLGDEDGVKEWLPHDLDHDNGFLSSSTDDGASQYRIKSRLCLAKYLDLRNNELTRLLNEVCTPGNQLVDETLRVMIVSSVAGGTGAGTFIQVALFLRAFFRSKGHNDINITGLFGLPALYVNAVTNDPGSKTNVSNMYSNAYAAIRELNAMNLAVSKGNKATGYGKSINIEIKTQSEGLLFDSNDPEFHEDENNKPFNLIYFIDESSADGGMLRSLDQYYAVMADIVHTRLYSPIEMSIRSKESNELNIHNNYPTAIYGSAGYGKIVYPYEGIIDYLATRRTYDELDSTWSAFENTWEKYKTERKKEAREAGVSWSPSKEERGDRYMADMEDFLSKPRFKYLTPMLEKSRVTAFINNIKKETSSDSGLTVTDKKREARYGLAKDPDVEKYRTLFVKGFQSVKENGSYSVDTVTKNINNSNNTFTLNYDKYVKALSKAAMGKASTIASQIIPQNFSDNAMAVADKDPINIFYGLLTLDGKAVHPLAARYLLYKLRKELKNFDTDSSSMGLSMELAKKHFTLALDNDIKDEKEYTMEDMLPKISDPKRNIFGKLKSGLLAPKTAMKRYYKNYSTGLAQMMSTATVSYQKEIFRRVIEVLDVLIDLYEKLFDNLDIFTSDLALRVNREKKRHETSSDVRCVFINASQREKEYIYSSDLETLEALEDCSDEIAAAAGTGIYNGLLTRLWDKLELDMRAKLIDGYEIDEDKNDFTEMKSIFSNVIRIYSKVLKEHAPGLRANAVEALLRQSCLANNVTKKHLVDGDTRIRVRSDFESAIRNMANKAVPMLNFDRNNVDTYYEGEDTDEAVAQTTYYMHIGIHPDLVDSLAPIYPSNSEEDSYDLFRTNVGGEFTLDYQFSPYEIVCFRAIHCLQPTQIYKFRESHFGGYYDKYKKRLTLLNSGKGFSNTPHLDKRWHLREAMPYISRSTELIWREKTVKAFIYALMSQKIKITEFKDAKCFNMCGYNDDTPTTILWPEKKPINLRDISKVIEFIAEDTELVEQLCKDFDETFEGILDILANQNEDMALYKTAVTRFGALKSLYGKLLVEDVTVSGSRAGRGENAVTKKKAGKYTAEEVKAIEERFNSENSEENDMNAKKSWNGIDMATLEHSFGGLLEIAVKIHKSEEAQNRDYDYGEAILEFGREVVEKLARNMCGNNVKEFTSEYDDYADLYNHILEKFIKYYVDSILYDRKLLLTIADEDLQGTVFYKYTNVPYFITNERDYGWIVKNWKTIK